MTKIEQAAEEEMSDDSKTIEAKAEHWAYTEIKRLMTEGIIPADAGTLELAEYSYAVGFTEGARCFCDCLRLAAKENASFNKKEKGE